MLNISTRERLLALQTTEELARKALKSVRRGYRKEGSYYLATDEIYDLYSRDMAVKMEQKKRKDPISYRVGPVETIYPSTALVEFLAEQAKAEQSESHEPWEPEQREDWEHGAVYL